MKNKEKKKKSGKKAREEKARKRRDSLSDAPVTSSGGSEQSSADGHYDVVDDDSWSEAPTSSKCIFPSPKDDALDLFKYSKYFEQAQLSRYMANMHGDNDPSVAFWLSMFRGVFVKGDCEMFLGLCRAMRAPMSRADLFFRDLSEPELLQHIIIHVADLLLTLNETLFTLLVSPQQPCLETMHGHCKLIAFLGDMCDRKTLQATLHHKDADGRTALYLAAQNNHTCIVHVLLELGADPNTRNGRGQSPAYEAMRNDSYEILNELTFYGGDLSYVTYNPQDLNFLEASVNYDVPYIKTWVSRRLDAMEKRFREYVAQATSDSITLKPDTKVSSLHVFPITKNLEYAFVGDVKTQTMRSIDLEMLRFDGMENPVLFFIPFCHLKQNVDPPADRLMTNRVTLFHNNRQMDVIFTRPILSATTGICEMVPIDDGPAHNGHIYAFRIPHTLLTGQEQGQKPRFHVNLLLELQHFTQDQLRYTHFMMQAYDLRPQLLDTKKNV
ncbi:unnamed protein product [Bursaphelenchus okinawaensis]|uniref:ANK_REP_REGION domain-containing protein n=1 Tax=Bursaphelenchus okinawaensis TaxID=465554 RepID=A0A811L9C6_9BILA|nr:unnamed protein product [Bursaphelenchus okinawaensis]CAG9121460.1 unnamed protein product [Bursaphelenchus okinawaensis]